MSEVTAKAEQQERDFDSPALRELVRRYPGLQAQIDRVVEERLKRERAGFETRLGEEVDRRTAALQAQLRERAALPDEREAVQRARQELGAERDAARADAAAWESRYNQGQAERVLLESAVRHGAYRPRQIVDLLAGRVGWEDGPDGPTPVLTLPGEDGGESTRYAGADLDKGVAAYLAANPNLLAASSGPGAGGRPGVPSLPITAEALRGLGVEQLRQLRPELERLASSLGR